MGGRELVPGELYGGVGGEDWAGRDNPVEGQEGRAQEGEEVRSPLAKQEVHGEQGGERGRRETDRRPASSPSR